MRPSITPTTPLPMAQYCGGRGRAPMLPGSAAWIAAQQAIAVRRAARRFVGPRQPVCGVCSSVVTLRPGSAMPSAIICGVCARG